MIKWFIGLNRHLRLAIILAPFLGILGFGLTDLWMTKDKPAPVQQPVVVHELELTGQCVLDAASCLLSKDEMNVMLKSASAATSDLLRIDIGASGHIRGLKLALVQDGKEEQLVAQSTMKTDRWYVEFPRKLLNQTTFTLRIALVQTKRVYIAEFSAQFS